MWRFKMKMKLRFRASHEHANGERRLHQWLEACAVHDANDAQDADAAGFAAAGDMPTVSPGGQTACEPVRGGSWTTVHNSPW